MRAEDYIPQEVLAGFGIMRDLMQRAISGEPQKTEFNIPYLDGRVRYFDITWYPVRKDDEIIALAEVTRDVTEQKEAEMESRRLREELIHMDRLNVMNTLTAAIAHEINQPLAAILSNAQAAVRLLNNNKDIDEVREALRDIIADDKRASVVITRLRSMLRKKPIEQNLKLSIHF